MDMEEMMKAAQEAAANIQKQMGEAQAKLDSVEVEGTAGGGLVKIRCTAKGRILGGLLGIGDFAERGLAFALPAGDLPALAGGLEQRVAQFGCRIFAHTGRERISQLAGRELDHP